ncbi:Por secretion system C-terminal sorting domain-containing protein [Ekhidna lutea]|uniref:Por secretion system C-terminal sorting domain-containing protein n=1 Tax=Ekhidna lutea TaxID=447679 RepID=A0A239J0U0_EKHLU|nr:T9SS type A sorting domain-containing protein [Ekhidna lutea]SNS99262.1 Por secretion system C-terminal sorting domain-containing protein [Ekhidna lutea]
MKNWIKISLIPLAVFVFCHEATSQLSLQGYTTNVVGGVSEGSNYSTEVSSGEIGQIPKGDNLRIFIGLPAANLETAVPSVNITNGSNTITELVDGYLLRIKPSGNYDTLDVVNDNNGGAFSFASVFHGDYLTVVDSDPEKYVATYYGDAFLWDEADTLVLTSDTTAQIRIEVAPPPRNENTGDGLVKGTIEEDFEAENSRIDGRRRAAKRKCGLRRKRSGGRVGQDNDEFELIAYGETNNNGEFEYGFLPQGTYRFFVEYPGIPLDESSFVQFDIGEAGVADNEFVLAAFVTEEGIKVELVLGITSEFFTDFSIYPNPSVGTLHVDYDKILSNEMSMQLIDLNGKVLQAQMLKKGKNGKLKLNLEDYPAGTYLLKFFDMENGKNALTFRVIKK